MKHLLWFALSALLLSSCKMSDSDRDRIYRNARKGDIDAMYRIVQSTGDNDTILSRDTLNAFRDTLLKAGPFAYLRDCYHKELAAYKPMSGNSSPEDSRQQRRDFRRRLQDKWWGIGMERGFHESFYERYHCARLDFDQSKFLSDSLEYVRYLKLCKANKAYEAEVNESMKSDDPVAWMKTELRLLPRIYVRNIHEEGLFKGTFRTAFFELQQWPVYFLFSYLFTHHWWKVLLFIVAFLGIFIALYISPFKFARHRANIRRPFLLGTGLAIVDSVCYFIAVNQHNYLWGKTIFSLWYPSYSYGLSPYIPILINWLVIGAMAYHLWKEVDECEGNVFVAILLDLAAFFIAYYIGTALLFIMILLSFLLSGASGEPAPRRHGNANSASTSGTGVIRRRDVDGLGTMTEVAPGVWEDALGTRYHDIGDDTLRGPGGDYDKS